MRGEGGDGGGGERGRDSRKEKRTNKFLYLTPNTLRTHILCIKEREESVWQKIPVGTNLSICLHGTAHQQIKSAR